MCIDIDNEEGGGRMERIFLVGNNNGLRLPIGDAPAGRVTSWCSRRVAVPGVYYLLIERPGSDTIDPATGQTQARAFRTVDFAIDRGDRWIYEVRRDRLLCVPAGGDC